MRRGANWTPAEDAILVRCTQAKLSSGAASRELPGRSPCACYKRAHYIGYAFSPKMGGTRPGSGVTAGYTRELRMNEPWSVLHKRMERERATIRSKAIALGIPTAYRPWADVVRDVERAA